MDDLDIVALDADHWPDLVTLFGPDRGAYGRCWCMFWRLTGAEFDALGGEGRRTAFHDRARQSPPAGLLAYHDGAAIGWIAVAPRDEFGRINRSPLLKRVDDSPVWAITCFYVSPAHRRAGVASRLIHGAVDLAAAHDADAVEAYPLDIDHSNDAEVYTGTRKMFQNAGFTEIARRRHRPIMRLHISAEHADCERH